jgi:phage terminase large subunit-like protein
MNMPAWDACADRSLKEERFAGKRHVAALGAAFENDLAARIKLFSEGDDYYIFCRHFVSETFLRSEGQMHLKAWARDGWICATPGFPLDKGKVREDLIGTKSDLAEIAFHPGQLTQFATELREHGLPTSEIPSTARAFAPAMKELEALVASKRLHHNGDPALALAVGSLVCSYDLGGGICRISGTDPWRIDAAVALIMALTRTLARQAPLPEVFVV